MLYSSVIVTYSVPSTALNNNAHPATNMPAIQSKIPNQTDLYLSFSLSLCGNPVRETRCSIKLCGVFFQIIS